MDPYNVSPWQRAVWGPQGQAEPPAPTQVMRLGRAEGRAHVSCSLNCLSLGAARSVDLDRGFLFSVERTCGSLPQLSCVWQQEGAGVTALSDKTCHNSLLLPPLCCSDNQCPDYQTQGILVKFKNVLPNSHSGHRFAHLPLLWVTLTP